MNEESSSPTPDPEGTYEPSLESTANKGTAAESQPKLREHALRSGLYVGIVWVVIGLIKWLIDPLSVTAPFDILGILSLLAALGLVIYFGRKFAETLTSISYGKAYIYSACTLFVSYLLAMLWSLSLFYVIDTDLPAQTAEKALNDERQEAVEAGLSEEKIEEVVEKRAEFIELTHGGPLNSLITLLIFSALLSLFYSLVTSIFVRKKGP